MTHASTEKPEALMKLADDYAEACFDQALHQRTTDDKPEAAREKLEKELRRLHARVQELEAQTAHMADLVELADCATKKLEASQARVPLSDEFMRDLIIFTAVGYGVDLEDAEANVAQIMKAARQLKSHPSGITQEKQG